MPRPRSTRHACARATAKYSGHALGHVWPHLFAVPACHGPTSDGRTLPVIPASPLPPPACIAPSASPHRSCCVWHRRTRTSGCCPRPARVRAATTTRTARSPRPGLRRPPCARQGPPSWRASSLACRRCAAAPCRACTTTAAPPPSCASGGGRGPGRAGLEWLAASVEQGRDAGQSPKEHLVRQGPSCLASSSSSPCESLGPSL